MKVESIKFYLRPLALADGDDTSPKRIQVLKVGTFDHPQYGRFTITAQDLHSFKENFDNGVRGIDIQANYDHGQSVSHGTKASGWIQSLTVEGEGKEATLWAEVEWTDQAVAEIKSKEWKYCSAEIFFEWRHPETRTIHKRVLEGLALTNKPFIKGMQALAASEHDQGDIPMKLSELKVQLAEHGIDLAELQKKAARAAALGEQVTQLTESLEKAQGTVKDLTKTNAELSEKVEKAEKAADEVGFQALVKRGMEEGRLTKSFAEGGFRKIFDSQGLKFAEETLAEMPKVINTDDVVGGGGNGDEKDPKSFKDPSAEVVHKAQKLAAEAKIDLSEAIDKVLDADPALAKRYGEWDGVSGATILHD